MIENYLIEFHNIIIYSLHEYYDNAISLTLVKSSGDGFLEDIQLNHKIHLTLIMNHNIYC